MLVALDGVDGEVTFTSTGLSFPVFGGDLKLVVNEDSYTSLLINPNNWEDKLAC